jgi:hypothetical protein
MSETKSCPNIWVCEQKVEKKVFESMCLKNWQSCDYAKNRLPRQWQHSQALETFDK